MPPEHRPTKRRKLLQVAALSAGAALATGANGCASEISVGPDVPDAGSTDARNDVFVGLPPQDVAIGTDTGPPNDVQVGISDIGPIGTDVGPEDATDDGFAIGRPAHDAGTTIDDAGSDT